MWDGDMSGQGSDESRADLALSRLAHFTNYDADQVDRLFRSSGLMRAKWDEKHHSDGPAPRVLRWPWLVPQLTPGVYPPRASLVANGLAD